MLVEQIPGLVVTMKFSPWDRIKILLGIPIYVVTTTAPIRSEFKNGEITHNIETNTYVGFNPFGTDTKIMASKRQMQTVLIQLSDGESSHLNKVGSDHDHDM